MAEINRHDSRTLSAQQKLACDNNMASNDPPVHRDSMSFSVLLTGANGFVGTEIIRQLLEHRQVSRVNGLVRGDTDTAAKQRTIDTAVKALWWTN
ncbi:hypothetical protein VN97_g9558 [Penicillium thymicola]|uniref:Thioester reductase (TE) domain-containing protein n=1 Tax=Penicillium thymicola TaxID=293382 RepID=A0AAI9TBG9_PENTH|nr:hypothetical protein VN97_g9558 [Penicillium thymicola]